MNKKFSVILLVFIAVCLVIGFANTDSEAEASTQPPPLPDDVIPSIPIDWPNETGKKPESVGGRVAERPFVFVYPSEESENVPNASANLGIDVWYGTPQQFGNEGRPQKWVNILGNIPSPTAGISLTYQLNGGSEMPLSIGPAAAGENNRLAAAGDFNVEVDYASLIPNNSNEVVIRASDGVSDTQKTVSFLYDYSGPWPKNFNADWSAKTDIQDLAQVVDGFWQIDGASVVIDETTYGYDRLLAIGDETWTEYEVMVPVTVDGLYQAGLNKDGQAGVGMILRWLGHNNDHGEQPNAGIVQMGALGWYRWNANQTEGIELFGPGFKTALQAKQFIPGTTYMFKMSVQSITDSPALYRFKYWEQGEEEPIGWDAQAYTTEAASETGSLALIAHNVSARFGMVQVKALEDIELNVKVNTVGEGIIVIGDEAEEKYEEVFGYSDRVNIYALPGPEGKGEGWEFAGWEGDIEPGNELNNPASFRIYQDRELTAIFREKEPVKLTTKVEPASSGSIKVEPVKSEYDWGEEIELTADPGNDYVFSHWTVVDLDGIQDEIMLIESPVTIVMDSNKEVTAEFTRKSLATPRSDDFQCKLNTNLWTIVNPAGDAEVKVVNNVARFNIPAGTPHNMWSSNSDALRIMQTTDDKNFEVEVKFNTLPTERFQMQGILIQQDNNNWLRFDFYHNGGSLVANAARMVNGNASTIKFLSVDPGNANIAYIKVARNGNNWTHSYKFDSKDWIEFDQFTESLEVSSSGIFVGNFSQTPGDEPAYNARVDYFFNTAAPIVPEDQGNTIEVDVLGQGQVQINPNKDTYQCGEEVTLTATPANDWLFAGWSGDFSSRANPATLEVMGDYIITATFSQGVDAYVFLPVIMRP